MKSGLASALDWKLSANFRPCLTRMCGLLEETGLGLKSGQILADIQNEFGKVCSALAEYR
ncbi:MAG TPA: hypothetical protein EYN26_08955 [Chromatiales bacterium]|nr:hypothetical protein [Chromatiaceae bacterium]HIO14757.1 hypothetical protein [Chromatiales bacterium]HIO55255.1 hypothetical protein [Chromatiales bacterium]